MQNVYRAAKVSPFRRMVVGGAPGMDSEVLREEDERSSIRLEYAVRCPGCKAYIPLIWEHFKWDGVREKRLDRAQENERRAKTVVYRSQCCQHEWKHDRLYIALKKGRWQTENGSYMVTGPHDPLLFDSDDNQIDWPEQVSMFVWAAYFTELTWADMVLEWINAQATQVQKAGFIAQVLGRYPFNENDSLINANNLYQNYRRDWSKGYPEEMLMVYACMDVQVDRVSCALIGFSENARTMYCIQRLEFYGDTSIWNDKCWTSMYNFLESHKGFKRKDGARVKVSLAVIDRRYNDQAVAMQWSSYRDLGIQTFLVYGAQTPPVGTNELAWNGRPIQLHGYELSIGSFRVDTNNAKTITMERFANPTTSKHDGAIERVLFNADTSMISQKCFFELEAEKRMYDRKSGNLYGKSYASNPPMDSLTKSCKPTLVTT